MDSRNPGELITEVKEEQQTRGELATEALQWFLDDNVGELFPRSDVVDILSNELDITNSQANTAISDTVGDIVDPVQQIVKGNKKYVGVIDYKIFNDEGAYGYVDFDDRKGGRKRVVCARCVEEHKYDENITHATQGEGSSNKDATWQRLLNQVTGHYADNHIKPPSDIEPGASLVSGTTISGNTAFHSGNESNIDHNNLSNRTHSGDDLSPSSVSSNTLEATDSITDPEGNTVTNLSDPVRVTEEVSTFSESDVTVTNNNTQINNGSIGLINKIFVDDFEDGDTQIETPNWNGWSGDIEAEAQTLNDQSGNFAGKLTADGAGVDTTATRDSNITSNLRFTIQVFDAETNDFVRIRPYAKDGQSLFTLQFNDGGELTLNGSTLLSTWDNNPHTYEFDFDFGNDNVEVFIDGTFEGLFTIANEPGWNELTITNFASNVRTVYIDNVISKTTPESSGDVLVSFDSGLSADIDSWDLVTYQETLDGETVTIDVEDSNGNVLKSDISKDTDISDITTSTDVQLRANLSRNDTANNPTVDYLARRFTR